jgi:hypothetical protein
MSLISGFILVARNERARRGHADEPASTGLRHRRRDVARGGAEQRWGLGSARAERGQDRVRPVDRGLHRRRVGRAATDDGHRAGRLRAPGQPGGIPRQHRHVVARGQHRGQQLAADPAGAAQ